MKSLLVSMAIVAYAASASLGQNNFGDATPVEIIARCTEIIDMDPTVHQAFFTRATYRAKLGDYRGAIEDYTAVLNLCEENQRWNILYLRGIQKGSLNDYLGAWADMNTAIEQNPRCAECFYMRGLAGANLDRMAQACSDFKRAAELGDSDAFEILRTECQ